MKYDVKSEQKLMNAILNHQVADNLANFVRFVYPWGQKDTPLEGHKGPRQWQLEDLDEMTAHLKEQRAKIAKGEQPRMWRKATASGRGVGKSALVSWLICWMMSTRLGSTTIVAANTEPQLKSRTFAEAGKWMAMAINAHWFEAGAMSFHPAKWFAEIARDERKIDPKYYYAQGQLWSEENPDAFAGVHNPAGLMVLFDEASGFPAPIFGVTEGFFTDPYLNRFWNVYSNPRRNSGGFFDCFHDEGAMVRWRRRHLDRRTVEGQDVAETDAEIEQYGIDSDHVRKEILGQFPKQGNKQFIGNDLVRLAQGRPLAEHDGGAPIILGVDIARYGDDSTVLRFRQGRDARSIPAIKLKDRDNMVVANTIAQWIDRVNPDAVNIDAGNGTGVIDRLRELKYRWINEVWFGGKSTSKEWANKRTEMYADLRDWLGGGCIDKDPRLFTDLTAPEYDYFGKASDSVMLEAKESMKGRGLPSPDDGDALALTFAVKVARRDLRASRSGSRRQVATTVDYDMFG